MKQNIPRRDFLKAASLMAAGALNANARAAEPAPGTIREPARDVPIAHECDVCVVGGSCTGVFAAVAAARLGATVAVIESSGFFGGVATAGLVNIWHSLDDRPVKQQIIAGLTTETIGRLRKRDAVRKMGPGHYVLNTEILKLELDKLVVEAKIRPFLHTFFGAPVAEGGRMSAVIIEDKTGRRAIRAKLFVDATGDADVAHRMGLETYRREHVQPPTTCCILRGLKAIKKAHPDFNIHKVVFDKKYPQAIRDGYAWSAAVPGDCGCPPEGPVPGADDLLMLAGTRVHGADCSDADQLTRAEMEGRRQVDSICELLREHFLGGKGVPLVALPAKIGIRESRHVRALHELTVDELLTGKRFPDAIANGTYRIDVHSASGAGVKFRELNKDVPFYQIPYASLVPRGAKNLLVAGRSLDADEQAFGGVRVMVNCNQTGEAAGVAAWLALDSGADVAAIDTARLRATLKKQGAAVV
ncbi:MAG: FAD-dependent oxidoreductase [Verrucomicrobia bacterium]|nr:FAD-dependent oxidoreductase [Verrucomicrobiota bacterium]